MASAIAREHLARAARALNAGRFPHLPPLILMTDETRLTDALASAEMLPKGAAVIVRHTDGAALARLAAEMKSIAHGRGLKLLVANDAALAARLGADGVHLSEARARDAFALKARRPDWLVTAAAHSARALLVAAIARADAALLAPAFPTRSHSERTGLGPLRIAALANASPLPVYALGGVDAHSVLRLSGARLAGVAAIGALSPYSP